MEIEVLRGNVSYHKTYTLSSKSILPEDAFLAKNFIRLKCEIAEGEV